MRRLGEGGRETGEGERGTGEGAEERKEDMDVWRGGGRLSGGLSELYPSGVDGWVIKRLICEL